MFGEALAKILRAQLGQYLDTEDLEVKVAFTKPIELKNVKLKESAFRDAEIPLRCVYGKIEDLRIDIPWMNPYSEATNIDIRGLFMLLVPTTSVGYDKEKEESAEQEAKMSKIALIEEAKQRNKLMEQKDEGGDSFVQKLMANIFKNLKVTVKDIHIRYEDRQTNREGQFSAGLTLDSLKIWTESGGGKEKSKKNSFNKLVEISSLAVYWQPHEKLFYSEVNFQEDNVKDIQFRSNIARGGKEVKNLKYLLGPISMTADLIWAPNPKRFNFETPLIDLKINMKELKLKVTRLQYKDFAQSLHSINQLQLAARYRKYKAETGLENLSNYNGKGRELWKFAINSILGEEVKPRLRMWDPSHIRQHIRDCREYRDRYRDKLLGKSDKKNEEELSRLELILDAFNIDHNRERAEILADNKRRQEAETKGKGWFGGWWGGKKKAESDESSLKSLDELLTVEDKRSLYEAIDYHVEAEEGTLEYPRKFVKFKVGFVLNEFMITIQDDSVSSNSVLCLKLENVNLNLSQRPAASNFKLEITLENLTVTGIQGPTRREPPRLISTLKNSTNNSKLLNFEFETKPPADPYGDLNTDKGSLFNRKLSLSTSPLEIIYDTKTIWALVDVFESPVDVKVDYLQEVAIDGIKEYKEIKMSQLGWEFAREHHDFFKVNITLESSYFLFPRSGEYSEGCPLLIANLGSVSVRSKEVTQDMVNSKLTGGVETRQDEDQAYDQFSIHLHNMELLMAQQGEDWRSEMTNRDSKLFLLKPINMDLTFKMCLIANDPDFPVYKLCGSLPSGISVNIEEKRLLILAEVVQDIVDPDDDMKYLAPAPPIERTNSESSFQSAVSSIETVSSMTGFIGRKQAQLVPVSVPKPAKEKDRVLSSKVTKLKVEFVIKGLLLDIKEDERPLFMFQLEDLCSELTVKNYNIQGEFSIGGCLCQQTKFRTSDGNPVALLSTSAQSNSGEKLLQVSLKKLEEKSPEWAGVRLSLSARMSSVDLCLHQDAILDLAKEATTWMKKLQSKASKLLASEDQKKTAVSGTASPALKLTRTGVIRRLSRQSSADRDNVQPKTVFKPRYNNRAKRKKTDEAIDLLIRADLKGVTAVLMTTKVNFARIQVEDLGATLQLSKSLTEIRANLRNFKIYDMSSNTLYRKIAECTGDQVLDVNIKIHEMLTDKLRMMGCPDVEVKAVMGEIKFVFLMKFVSDFLEFIDPFTNMKEFITEQAQGVYDRSARIAEEAYSKATKVKLNIDLTAPIIVLPVSSRKPFTFEANLGNLTLNNKHHSKQHYAHHVLLDTIDISLTKMRLSRSKIQEDSDDNSTIGSCEIIKPIDFDLEVTRNMEGAIHEKDIPEIQVKGTLREISVELSKDDYDTLIAMVIENFQEKGLIEKVNKSASLMNKKHGRPSNLPLNKSEPSKISTASLASSHKSFDLTEGKSKKAKLVDFDVEFKGLKLKVFKDRTDLSRTQTLRDPRKALAQIAVNNLSVTGDYRVSGAIKADAKLNDVVLEDIRPTVGETSGRIVRLLESRKVEEKEGDMVTVNFTKDDQMQESVVCHIKSFVVVASVSYLQEIGFFFMPEDLPHYETFFGSDPTTHYAVRETEEPQVPLVRTILVKMDEPDIVLVSKIEDINTDAIMLNAKLTLNITQQTEKFAFVLTVDSLRGHTCKFNPAIREQSLAQILQPTNMGMHFNTDTDSNRTRIDINFNHLVFNVSPASIYILYNSYQTFMENLSAREQEEEDNSEVGSWPGDTDSHLWENLPYSEEDLWYLKADEALDLVNPSSDNFSLASSSSVCLDQQLMFNINQLIVTVEAGQGNNTVPMLLLESKLAGEVRNWSGRLSVSVSTQLEMAYYNSKFALWEPVIEPIGYLTNTGRTAYTRWSLDISYHSNSAHDLGSGVLSPNFAADEPDGFICPENLPPLTEIGIHSTETLQITITKSFLAVLNSLQESFSPSALEKISLKEVPEEPFLVVNQTGKPLTLMLGDNKNFSFYHSQDGSNQLEVEDGSRTALNLKFNRNSADSQVYRNYNSPLKDQNDQSEATLRIKVEKHPHFDIPINKADTRFFKFPFRGSEHGYEPGVLSTVHVENGTKYVTLTSILSFKNNYPANIKIWSEGKSSTFSVLAVLEKGQTWHCPIDQVYTETGNFYFSLDGPSQNMGLTPISWRESRGKKVVECTNKVSDPNVFLNIERQSEAVFSERSSELSECQYRISIRPNVVIKNCLPMPLHYKCSSSPGNQRSMITLEEGQIGCLEDLRLGHTLISLMLFGWRETDLKCDHVYDANMKTLEYWRFDSATPERSNLRIDLGVMKDESKGTIVLSIFAPFWFVNKTRKTLHFKGHDGNSELVHYQEEEDIPMMFSYISKPLLGKKKINLKVESSLWSDAFTIDTIGDTGKISCKLDSRRGSLKRNFQKSDKKADDAFQVGIQISQSSSSFTKIVTFTPYYMIYNSAQFGIILKEVEDEAEGVLVPAGQCLPFWPIYGGSSIVCQAQGYHGVTVPFSLTEQNPTLLMLSNKYGGIYVRIKTDNSSQSLVTLSGYKAGYAPVLLVNNTPTWDIEYGDAGSQSKKFLKPGEKVLFTWERPSGSRTLVWSVLGVKESKENSLTSDEYGVFQIGNGRFAWVSFLDGMQRVLLFTNQPEQAQQLAKTTGESERIEQEMDVSIYGVGLSLVNNDSEVRRELSYLSVTSSNIVWEIRKEGKQRYKSLTQGQCQAIEHDFMVYSRLLSIGKNPRAARQIENTNIVLDYETEKMEAPYKGRLRRQFQKGLWFQMRTSKHQTQFHLKINHVQLDNQLGECLYPVIAAPVPPPRTVMAESVPKPFIELSILEYTSPEHNTKQYKYIHALVQEMHLKIEMGFINALMELFEEDEVLEENTGEKLKLDLNHARKDLKEHAVLTVTQGKKDFYDYLHLSPLKVHVSFSLTSYTAKRQGVSNSRNSNFIKHLLQSFGVTITDSNDIIFRLAFFERKHQFYNIDDLQSEMTRHYTSQAIKQMYVILLGLDVIGNPFGLAVGVARGVEDLFYEPFQGAVEGPSEFAEGLAIGVQSVFSGVLGGAAGTVSKITGALGKGLASLTFDEKYMQKRRETIKRRAHNDNLAVGMARNTKELGMGFIGGISGVVMKPIEGARDEGVGGFFKGVGKGVAGLVTRPTGGIVDFASGTFDTVKRATELNDEVSRRARQARYIHPDGVVRYYDKKEAIGAKMVSQVDKGRLARDVYIMHENIIGDREILVLTNKRVLYIQTNPVMGGWSTDWEYEYSALAEYSSPIENEDKKWYLIIQHKEEKKSVLGLFGKNSSKKIILPQGSTMETAQSLSRLIEDLRVCGDNFEPVFMRMIQQKNK